MSREGPRRGRVVASHRIALTAFRLGGAFAVVSIAWAIWTAVSGGSWWGPIHSFLAGTVLLAISGATQLFTITWAAAPPPRAVIANAQRWVLATGAGLALVGVSNQLAWMAAVGAVLVVVALALLGGTLVGAVRRSLLRRFDASSRFYLLALGAGGLGVVLGGLLGSGVAGASYSRLRLVHSHLNLVGLIGLTVAGTLPTILPTFAHHRSVSGREVRLSWWLAAASVAAIASGVAWGEVPVGIGTIAAGGTLLVVLAGVVLRLGRRGLAGGLAYLQVGAGCLWLIAWAAVDGGRLVLGTSSLPFSPWTGAVILAGVGQVLVGSLAYLLPVLAGPPPRLGRNLDRANRRPWLVLASANLAGVAVVAGSEALAVVAAGVWVLDLGYRLVRMEWRDPKSE